jgi:hypothetical protein
MKNKEITLEQILKLLPACVSLYYVDYRENLNHRIDLLLSCVSGNSLDKLREEIQDVYWSCETDTLDYYKKELQSDIKSNYGIDKEAAEQLVSETYAEEIEEKLYERDDSDVVGDLFKNTGAFSVFIDTGLEIEDGSWQWTRSEQSVWLRKIKRKLKITVPTWDNDIRQMLSQASYGGQLVVYFYENVDSLITGSEKDWQSVSFTDPAIAIINTQEGSGDHCHLTGHRFTMPFVRENLFIDRYFKYNYVSAVCGMYQDWCGNSQAAFSYEKTARRKSAASPRAEQALQDREYAETYRKGGCTFGDMDISRHRDVKYINDIPCGSQCPHCGTFWID